MLTAVSGRERDRDGFCPEPAGGTAAPQSAPAAPGSARPAGPARVCAWGRDPRSPSETPLREPEELAPCGAGHRGREGGDVLAVQHTRPAQPCALPCRKALQIDGPYDEAFYRKLLDLSTEDDGTVAFALTKVGGPFWKHTARPLGSSR